MKTNLSQSRAPGLRLKFALMGALLLCAFLLALLLGGAPLRPAQVLNGLLGRGDGNIAVILRHVRLPRAVAALLAGMGLSLSGLLIQGVTGNSLASPNLIGVNAGAGLCTVLCLAFFPAAVGALPFAAFAGAFAAALLILGAASRMGAGKSAIILAGMALTTLLNAGISFVTLLDSDVVALYNYFSIGGLSGVSWERLGVPALLILAALAASLLLAPKISLLCLGDSIAASLGVRVRALRMVCLVCASAAAAAVVSFAGLLGFVGLIVPHMARRIAGEKITRSLPVAMLIGPTLLILADTIGRTLFAPSELPVGIVMALIGAPFFLWLLMRRKRHA